MQNSAPAPRCEGCRSFSSKGFLESRELGRVSLLIEVKKPLRHQVVRRRCWLGIHGEGTLQLACFGLLIGESVGAGLDGMAAVAPDP